MEGIYNRRLREKRPHGKRKKNGDRAKITFPDFWQLHSYDQTKKHGVRNIFHPLQRRVV